MTIDENERDAQLASAAGTALRAGVASTAESRARIMELIRAEPLPRRGEGSVDDVVVPSRRRFWRSPAAGLLAAASIGGIVALVHALRVTGPIPEVPGQPRQVAREGARHGRNAQVAPASAPAATAQSAEVQFVFVAPAARTVSLVGDFNDWDPSATPLSKAGAVWSASLPVPVGRHDYAFVVDGGTWVADPGAPRAPADEFGKGYSVIVVGAAQ